MIYEFWDVRSNNLVDAVSSEAEAREMLRRAVTEQGEWIVEFLMLIEDDPATDSFRRIGIGSELLDYIRDAA
jgi:plasmid stability protein